MLFSQPETADYINATFEPAWQAVRPVPIVRIDFGNGNVITRTLHGNIATYVCTADGQVLDVLPGIYEPVTYRDQLRQFHLLHQWIARQAGDPAAVLADYHRAQGRALKQGKPRQRIVNLADLSKKASEGRLQLVLTQGPPNTNENVPAESPSGITSPGDLANWRLLAEDTHVNESLRRKMIHDYLLTKGKVSPDAMKKWLYREVLHADLDDPYLGLGEMLFANYPFRAEDES